MRNRARRLAGIFVGLGLLFAATPAIASDEPLAMEAEVTLGVRLYDIDEQDNDFVAGFWDQYRHTRKKNKDVPFFFDALHLDMGLARADDTYLIRLERWSPNATNDRIDLDLDHRGLRFDLDYRRYRSEELRVFPTGTDQAQNLGLPFNYGTLFNPDASLAEIQNQNRRFWLRRTSVDGELRFRPDGFGFVVPVLAEASIRSGFESRKGYRHDRFLLNANRETSNPPNQQWRGNRRRTDQEVENVGGNVVLELLDTDTASWTHEFDIDFESFEEKASPVTFSEIAAQAPLNLFPSPQSGLRAFNYTPDTDRVTAHARSNLKLGDVAITAAGFVSHLQQTNEAPLQRVLGIDKQEVLTTSGHVSIDAPIGDRFEFSGHVKVAERRNDLELSDFQTFSARPILRRRTEVDAEAEFAMRPAPGALAAVGYRYEWIDRNIRQPGSVANPPVSLAPSLSLVEDGSERHALYVRGRARLMRRLQLAGELGWEYAPERDYPIDPTSTVYFDARGSYTLPRPFPITLAINGGVRDGHGSGRVLDAPTSEARKDLDRQQWNYTLSVAGVPTRRASVAVSFTQHHDRQDFPFVRFEDPAAATSGSVEFFANPDRPHFQSDVKSLSLNAGFHVTDTIEVRHFQSIHWLSTDFDSRSDTSIALENVNEIDQRIVSVGFGLGWQAVPGLDLDLGYRIDRFLDDEERGPLETDDTRHTFTVGATVGLDLFIRD